MSCLSPFWDRNDDIIKQITNRHLEIPPVRRKIPIKLQGSQNRNPPDWTFKSNAHQHAHLAHSRHTRGENPTRHAPEESTKMPSAATCTQNRHALPAIQTASSLGRSRFVRFLSIFSQFFAAHSGCKTGTDLVGDQTRSGLPTDQEAPVSTE